jgi:hypothetical protein
MPVAQYLSSNASHPLPNDGGGDSPSNPGNDGAGGTGGAEDPDPNPGGNTGTPEACDGFQCNDGQCIDSGWRCDGLSDCSGGEDEQGCPTGGANDPSAGDPTGGDPTGSAPACDGFECNDGVCIDESWRCDEIVDCAGGEDEAGCAMARAPFDGAFQDDDAAAFVSQSCLATWTTSGAAAGTLAGEAIAKACTGGGAVLGFVSGGTGFAAATVCAVGDGLQVDAIAGGVFGALSGLTGGLVFCEGGALDMANQALNSLLSSRSIPTFKVETKDNVCPPCPAPPAFPSRPGRLRAAVSPPSPVYVASLARLSLEVNQNPSTCECFNNKREEVLCYDPVADPDIASDPIWAVCGV